MSKNQIKPYLSPNQKAFIRFKKNIPAIAGFWVVVIAVIIAILGYLISPDATTHTNEQILEIATSSPGYKTQILKVRKNRPIEKTNILKKMLVGKENRYELYPLNDFKIEGDSLYANIYTGLKNRTNRKTFHLVDVVHPLNLERNINDNSNNFTFKDAFGNQVKTNTNQLTKTIEKKLISQKKFWLGTDKFGRDNLSRLILGVRVSISVGLLAAFISLIIGVFMGSMAGFYRNNSPKVSIWILPAIILSILLVSALFGIKSSVVKLLAVVAFPFLAFLFSNILEKAFGKIWNKQFTLPVDDLVMWVINVFWSIPLLLLVFAMVLALGREFWQIYLAVGLTMWVEIARIVRGQFMSLREKEFVEAAESLGFNNFRIIVKHILPNCIGPLIVITAANFATAIIIEAGLSFLGIGVQPPRPSWGIMLNEYYQYIGSSKSFLALIPGLAIMILVLAFNLLGNGLRDAFDVKTKV